MGSKNNPGVYDCYENALPDEPMFVLLARDKDAPLCVLFWAFLRDNRITNEEAPLTDINLIDEAKSCAKTMADWREKNWKK